MKIYTLERPDGDIWAFDFDPVNRLVTCDKKKGGGPKVAKGQTDISDIKQALKQVAEEYFSQGILHPALDERQFKDASEFEHLQGAAWAFLGNARMSAEQKSSRGREGAKKRVEESEPVMVHGKQLSFRGRRSKGKWKSAMVGTGLPKLPKMPFDPHRLAKCVKSLTEVKQ